MGELKPCPFCGCVRITIRREKPSIYRVACENCHVFMNRRVVQDKDDEAYTLLLQRWNRRASTEKENGSLLDNHSA